MRVEAAATDGPDVVEVDAAPDESEWSVEEERFDSHTDSECRCSIRLSRPPATLRYLKKREGELTYKQTSTYNAYCICIDDSKT
jgi:hypothetical protein